jgi:hypothetical protein
MIPALYLLLAVLGSDFGGVSLCGTEPTMKAVLGSSVRSTILHQRCPAPARPFVVSKPAVRRLVCMAEQSKTDMKLDKSTPDDVWKKLLSAEQV